MVKKPESEPNMRVLKPSRKKVHVGDVFAMQMADEGFVFGRVVSTDARWSTFEEVPGMYLVYVYAGVSPEKKVPDRALMSVDNLLLPPKIINRVGWSRGYMETIANVPFEEGELLSPHCFYDSVFDKYVDEFAQTLPGPVGPERAIGSMALGNYRVLDDLISEALGIPLAP